MITAVIIAAGVVLALAEFVTWWRTHSRTFDLHQSESWLEDFSSAAYRPMIRLAEPDDAGFLAAHSGPEEAARYRRWQRRALRTYLRRLSLDFQRLHTLAAAAPWRLLKFLIEVRSVEVRLLLNSALPRAVDLRPLLATMDDLAAEARTRHQNQI
ncbi:MAG TPA: hypothetical protein VGM43_19310 [Bryobacteraceae bacterium]|jgi:hypothetical protein